MIEFLINQIFDANLLVAMCIAALAGLISFFSPCVIPLVPGYLSYASGMSDVKSRSRVFLGSILFVLGFTSFLFLMEFYLENWAQKYLRIPDQFLLLLVV